jgi:hypothetical protein
MEVLEYKLHENNVTYNGRSKTYYSTIPIQLNPDDNELIYNKFQRGDFGDIVVETDTLPDKRVQDIILDSFSYPNVVFRSGFHTVGSYIIPYFKKSAIDYSRRYTVIYSKESFLKSHYMMFSSQFNVDIENHNGFIVAKFVRARQDTIISNQDIFDRMCARHNVKYTGEYKYQEGANLVDTPHLEWQIWNAPDNYKFSVTCLNNPKYHNNYDQSPFLVLWKHLLGPDKICPSCIKAAERSKDVESIVNILNTESKIEKAEKLLDFINTKIK